MQGTRAHPLVGEARFPHSTGSSFCFCVAGNLKAPHLVGEMVWKDHVKKPRTEGEALSLHGLRLLHQRSLYLTLQLSWAPVTTSESTGKPLREAESHWQSYEQIKKPLGALTRSEQAIFPKQLWCGMRVIRYLQGGGLAITSFSLLTWRKHLSPHHQLKLLDPSRPSQVNGWSPWRVCRCEEAESGYVGKDRGVKAEFLFCV